MLLQSWIAAESVVWGFDFGVEAGVGAGVLVAIRLSIGFLKAGLLRVGVGSDDLVVVVALSELMSLESLASLDKARVART